MARREIFLITTHYTPGGIRADHLGEVVGCKNLFAIGECRADGSKNGGRLPGYPFTSSIIDAKNLSERFSQGKNKTKNPT